MSKSVSIPDSIQLYAGDFSINISMENQTPESIERLLRLALFNMLDKKVQKLSKAQRDLEDTIDKIEEGVI